MPRLIQLGGELAPSQPEARAQRQDRESLFLCQEQLNEITKRKQPLVIKKRGNYASISGEFTT